MKKSPKKRLKQRERPSTRIFSWAVNSVAFIDKIVLSVDGHLKSDFENELHHPVSRGIRAKPTSLYSRAVSGVVWLSGNPADVVYGRRKRFKNVPTVRVTIHSKRVPVTGAQVMMLIKSLTAGASEIRVSNVEFTFDVTGATIDYVRTHLIYRAQLDARVLSDGQRITIYAGSPHSAWQVRIYEKTRTTLRLEFILRRSYLSRHGINQPEDLLLLRKLNVWELLSVRRFSASSAARVTKTWDNTIGKELVLTWGEYRRPLRLLPRILRNHKVDPDQVLQRTRLQKKMQEMQKRFVW
jgi:hypothetical protein